MTTDTEAEKIERWRQRQTLIQWCALLLRSQDLDAARRDAEFADAVGPLLHPTLYRDKREALEIDRRRIEAAARFAQIPIALPVDAFTLGPCVMMIAQALGEVPRCDEIAGCIGHSGHAGACRASGGA